MYLSVKYMREYLAVTINVRQVIITIFCLYFAHFRCNLLQSHLSSRWFDVVYPGETTQVQLILQYNSLLICMGLKQKKEVWWCVLIKNTFIHMTFKEFKNKKHIDPHNF